MIILVISCVLCILMEKGGGGQRRLNDEWNRVWIELLEEGRGKGGGRPCDHNWSAVGGFCYSDGDLMITRKDIETATDHPSCPIDR